jgi:hypothetical protein
MSETSGAQEAQTARSEKEKEYRSKLSQRALDQFDSEGAIDERNGTRYDPFRAAHPMNQEGLSEAKIEQIFTGAQGRFIALLGEGDRTIAMYGDLSAKLRQDLFPQGLEPTYVNQLRYLNRLNQLDVAYRRVLDELERRRAAPKGFITDAPPPAPLGSI